MTTMTLTAPATTVEASTVFAKYGEGDLIVEEHRSAYGGMKDTWMDAQAIAHFCNVYGIDFAACFGLEDLTEAFRKAVQDSEDNYEFFTAQEYMEITGGF